MSKKVFITISPWQKKKKEFGNYLTYIINIDHLYPTKVNVIVEPMQ